MKKNTQEKEKKIKTDHLIKRVHFLKSFRLGTCMVTRGFFSASFISSEFYQESWIFQTDLEQVQLSLKLCSFEAKVTSFEIDKLQILKLQACGFVHVNHVASFFHTLKFEKGVGVILQQTLGLCTTTISCLLYMRLTNHVSCLTLPKLLHFLVDYLSYKIRTTCLIYIYIYR